jgi:hypothetical protein
VTAAPCRAAERGGPGPEQVELRAPHRDDWPAAAAARRDRGRGHGHRRIARELSQSAVHPDVTDSLQDLSRLLQPASKHAEEIRTFFLALQEEDIRRITQPRPDAETWDVRHHNQ